MMKNNRSTPPQHQGSRTFEARNGVHGCKEDDDKAAAARSHAVENKAASTKPARKPSLDIDASAEAFIKKFRQQLVIQRLESIENYEKMLARGL
ncbi:hypothetical protein OIU84_004619 [Salix udensis]|uniref:DUF761 domain-containing protein n=1 Tax=Salix udensis TaxID=889485 RepID=A0AAD6K2L8_9ROSI|nr:hypothetical protein OIU84_004619 [Salix udensis]